MSERAGLLGGACKFAHHIILPVSDHMMEVMSCLTFVSHLQSLLLCTAGIPPTEQP